MRIELVLKDLDRVFKELSSDVKFNWIHFKINEKINLTFKARVKF